MEEVAKDSNEFPEEEMFDHVDDDEIPREFQSDPKSQMENQLEIIFKTANEKYFEQKNIKDLYSKFSKEVIETINIYYKSLKTAPDQAVINKNLEKLREFLGMNF